MKKLTYIILLAAIFASCDDNTPTPNKNTTTETININMGAEYANDVYYSLEDGIISTVSRTEWDIAFYTSARSASILINDGNGVLLYVVDEIANWDQVTSVPTNINAQYNIYSDSTWQNGAFDQNATGYPDYGWGFYDAGDTHNVVGDSIHVIVLADGTPKKLIIEKRDATTNSYFIKYANLDGTNEVSDIISCGDYADQNMIHYSLKNQSIIEHEPSNYEWDLMFTKYYDESIPYKVTGVLTNNDIMVAKLHDTDTANNDYSAATYSKVLNTIGSDWKSFNMETYTYDISENLVYFAQDKNGKYYKLVFTSFEGSTTGNIEFEKTTY